MLVTGDSILKCAQKHHFAVPAFNAGSGQLLPAVMDVCKEQRAPFIMAIHPDELSFLRDSYLGQVKDEINATDLPVAIHLDHGANIQQVYHAIQLGFTSVMIDSSHLPFEENLKTAQEVVEVAHAVGVSVEAELGTIGDTGNSIEGGVTEVTYTDPDKAAEFVERTGIDSLAVAIGTAHGLYPKNVKPELRMDILEAITKVVSVPLVLHGGSSNPDDEIARAVELGIAKINISSDIKISFAEKLKQVLDEGGSEIREPNVMFPEPMEACKATALDKIKLFKTADTKKYYFESLV